MSVAAQVQLTAGVAIAVSQNKAAEDKEEINLEVTAVPKTETKDIQIKQRHSDDAIAEVKECNQQRRHSAHGSEAPEHHFPL